MESPRMTIAEQALILLDILPARRKRRKLENFSDLETTVRDSLGPAAALANPVEEPLAMPAPSAPSPASVPYSMATRMQRPDYEDQARADALTNALRQLRAANQSKFRNGSRVIRQS